MVRYPENPNSCKNEYEIIKDFANNRIPIIAKMIGIFIMAIQSKWSQKEHHEEIEDIEHIEISGWSMGGQIANRVSRFLTCMNDGKKVKFLIGMK